MHLGTNNKNAGYQTEARKLEATEEEGDLHVPINCTIVISCQRDVAKKKNNAVLGSMRQGIFCRGKEVLVSLYKAL